MERNKEKEIMTVIRRNTKPSRCINNFEKLLSEIENEKFINTVFSDLSGLITGMMTLFASVDKISDNKKLVSKILNTEFINPKQYFKKTRKEIKKYSNLSYSLYRINRGGRWHDTTDIHILKVDSDLVIDNRYASDEKFTFTLDKSKLNFQGIYDINIKNSDYLQEQCRKAVLIWNILPAIYKALLQTKRRSLGFDNNSKKF